MGKEGTFPKGSTWRSVGKYVKSATTLRKDSVVVPADLKPGNYVLGWRWDGSGGNQVWVSCASMKLVPSPSVRKVEDNEDDEEPLYTDEEYALRQLLRTKTGTTTRSPYTPMRSMRSLKELLKTTK